MSLRILSTLPCLGRFCQLLVLFFFGASLTALPKPDTGVRPIAVGCTIRRLVAKCAALLVKEDMGSLLFPSQLGYGTPRGAEGTVHAARIYLSNLESGKLLMKLGLETPLISSAGIRCFHQRLPSHQGSFPLSTLPTINHQSFSLVITRLNHLRVCSKVTP